MKKSYLKNFGIFAICTLMVPCFTACKDDDKNEPESNPGDGSATATIHPSSITTDDETYNFFYNSQDRVIEISSEYETLLFDYEAGKIISSDDDVYDAKFNNAGYITELSLEENSSVKVVTKYEYNSSGNITKIVDKETYNGNDFYSSTLNFDWQNGNLVKITGNYEQIDPDYTDKGTLTLNYEYSDLNNKFYQLPMAYDFGYMIFGAAGLFGKGPKKLPKSVTIREKGTDSEDGNYDETETTQFGFRLNSDGSIAKEWFDGDEDEAYYYGYGENVRSTKTGVGTSDKRMKKNLLLKPLRKYIKHGKILNLRNDK